MPGWGGTFGVWGSNNLAGLCKVLTLLLCLQGLCAAPSRTFASGGVAGRYASALFTVAGKKQMFIVGSELEGLNQLRSEIPAFDRLIADPTVPDNVKGPALDAVLTKGGYSEPLKKFFGESKRRLGLCALAACGRFSWHAVPLLLLQCSVRPLISADVRAGVLLENNRLGYLGQMTSEYAKLLAAERDEMTAKVTTAVAMTAKQTKALERTLADHKQIGNGKAVTITPVVDPKIRGGMIVELDDKIIDVSTAKKLQEFQMSLVA